VILVPVSDVDDKAAVVVVVVVVVEMPVLEVHRELGLGHDSGAQKAL